MTVSFSPWLVLAGAGLAALLIGYMLAPLFGAVQRGIMAALTFGVPSILGALYREEHPSDYDEFAVLIGIAFGIVLTSALLLGFYLRSMRRGSAT